MILQPLMPTSTLPPDCNTAWLYLTAPFSPGETKTLRTKRAKKAAPLMRGRLASEARR